MFTGAVNFVPLMILRKYKYLQITKKKQYRKEGRRIPEGSNANAHT